MPAPWLNHENQSTGIQSPQRAMLPSVPSWNPTR